MYPHHHKISWCTYTQRVSIRSQHPGLINRYNLLYTLFLIGFWLAPTQRTHWPPHIGPYTTHLNYRHTALSEISNRIVRKISYHEPFFFRSGLYKYCCSACVTVWWGDKVRSTNCARTMLMSSETQWLRSSVIYSKQEPFFNFTSMRVHVCPKYQNGSSRTKQRCLALSLIFLSIKTR